MKKILLIAFAVFALAVPLKSSGTEEGCGEEGECLEGDCNNGRGMYVFSDGSSYRGEWKDGFPDGFGALHYSDGSKNEGEWLRGMYLGERKIETGAGELLR
jgi:hypothetical protein